MNNIPFKLIILNDKKDFKMFRDKVKQKKKKRNKEATDEEREKL